MVESPNGRGHWQTIVSIIAIAFAVRIALVAAMGRVDGETVIQVFPAANAIARGDLSAGFDPAVPPLYPVLVAVGRVILGDVEIGARAISVVGGVLAALPILLLVRRIYGESAGRAALFLLAIQPLFCRYSAMARGEVPAAVFFAWSVYLAWRLLERPAIRMALALGLVSGIGFLIRPECLAVPAVATIWVVVSRGPGPWRGRLIAALSVLGPLLVILGVHAVWIHGRTGTWTISPRIAIGLEHAEGLPQRRPPWALTEDGKEVVFSRKVGAGEYSTWRVAKRALQDPGEAVGRTFLHGLQLAAYLPETVGYANLLLLPFGIAALGRGARRRPLLFICSVIGFTLAALSLFHPARRMVVFLVPLAVIFPAVGLARMSDRLAERPDAWGRRWVVILWTTVILVTVPFLGRTAYKYEGWWSPMRYAGMWARGTIYGEGDLPGIGIWGRQDDRGEKRVRIMAHPPDLGHFAGGEVVFFPRDTYERTIRYARLKGAEFIAYELGMAWTERPEFEASAKEDEHLEPMGHITGPVRVLLYRLK